MEDPQGPPKCRHGKVFNAIRNNCQECVKEGEDIKSLVNPLIDEWFESKGENLSLYHYIFKAYRMGMRNEHLK